ncbi:MAG: peptidylprolyl isomerase [Patescibacteria group bacterium]
MQNPQKVSWPTIKRELKKRWFLLAVLATYLGLGGLFTVLIYQFHWDQPATRWAGRVFPLPAASVNGEMIWLSHYYRRLGQVEYYQAASAAKEQSANLPADQTEIRIKTLDALIEGKIFRQQTRHYGITVTDQEVTATHKKLAESQGGEEKFASVINQFYGITPFQFSQEYIREQIYREKAETQLFTQVHPRWIIIEDEARARAVLDRAKAGEDFGELVKQFSQDANTLEKGGDLGWIKRGRYQKPIEDVIFSLKIGEVSPDVTKTDAGFVIAKIEERQDAPISDLSFAEWVDKITVEAKVTRFVARIDTPNPNLETTPVPVANPAS